MLPYHECYPKRVIHFAIFGTTIDFLISTITYVCGIRWFIMRYTLSIRHEKPNKNWVKLSFIANRPKWNIREHFAEERNWSLCTVKEVFFFTFLMHSSHPLERFRFCFIFYYFGAFLWFKTFQKLLYFFDLAKKVLFEDSQLTSKNS